MEPKNQNELEIIELDERLDLTIDPLVSSISGSLLGDTYCKNIDCCHKSSGQ